MSYKTYHHGIYYKKQTWKSNGCGDGSIVWSEGDMAANSRIFLLGSRWLLGNGH